MRGPWIEQPGEPNKNGVAKGQKFEIKIRTLINSAGEAISSMKVEGIASADQIINTLQSMIDGIKKQAERKRE